nr:zinc finger, CCHC-type [Tanacetum cinerariifolium]
MSLNFAKLDKFEGVDFKRWQKKMHFLLSSMSVVYVLTTPMPANGGDNPTVEQVKKRAKWDNDDYVYICLILNDFKHTLKHLKELTLLELGSHLRIKESLRAQDNDKTKCNNVVGPSVVNMVEHNNSSGFNDNRGNQSNHDTKVDPNKKPKVTCWKCGKPGHFKKDCKAGNIGNKANGSDTKGSVDGSSNLVFTTPRYKDECLTLYINMMRTWKEKNKEPVPPATLRPTDPQNYQ